MPGTKSSKSVSPEGSPSHTQQTSAPARLRNRAARASSTRRVSTAQIPTTEEYEEELTRLARETGVSESSAIRLAVRRAYEYEAEPDRNELLDALHKVALAIDELLVVTSRAD